MRKYSISLFMISAPLISPDSLFGSQQTKSEWRTSSTTSSLPWPNASSNTRRIFSLFSSDMQGTPFPSFTVCNRTLPVSREGLNERIEGLRSRRELPRSQLSRSRVNKPLPVLIEERFYERSRAYY